MFGDSITHYWETWSEPEEAAIRKELWDRYYGSLGALNLGFAGDQCENLIWRLRKYPFENVHPKLVIVLCGVNDVPTGHDLEKIAYANRYAVKMIQKQWPDVNIIVLRFLPYAWMNNRQWQQQVEECSALLPLYFRDMKNVELVDISDMYLNEDGTLNKNFFPDLVHPNRDGYLLWGERLKKLVNEKLK